MAKDTTLKVGDVLDGRYRIEAQVGSGGMAIVYRAIDLRLDTPCAVKVMHPGPTLHEKARKGFLKEAKIVARMRHPNIVGVRDAMADEDRCYIVMDFVRGETGEQRLKRQRIGPREALRIVAAILSGLEEAHSHRDDRGNEAPIIHRDIKPGNILLGDDGKVVVADFGIAHFRPSEDAKNMTQAVMGTLEYMSPEQKDGSLYVDHRTDIFSVGATLWALLKGRTPNTIVMADREPEMLKGMPKPVAEIVVRAVKFRKEQRFASAVEMRKVVIQVMEALPPDVVPDGPPTPPPKPPSRRHTLRAPVNQFAGRSVNWRALAVIAAAAIVGVIAWQSREHGPPESDVKREVQVPRRAVPTQPAVAPTPESEAIAPHVDPSAPSADAAEKRPQSPKQAEKKPQYKVADTTPHLAHKPLKRAQAGSTVSISAEVRNAAVEKVWLFSRTAGTTRWESKVMALSGTTYTETLIAVAPGIEYYIDPRLPDGSSLPGGGDRFNYHSITVP